MSMAEETEKREDQNTVEESGGGNGGGHRGAVRAAAIAAATGATAFAAKKALSGGGDRVREGKQKASSGGGQGGDSMLGDMVASGWSAARDSLLPFAEEAAGAAGEWVGRNSPELVRDSLVPRFIRGFEKAKKSSSGDE
jgi:hypothetical protein